METRTIQQNLNRREAVEAMNVTLTRFSALLNNLSTDPRSRLYDEKLTRIINKFENENYYLKVNQFFLSGEYDRLSADGVRDLLLKMRELSQKFCLKVEIPQNIIVIAENVIVEFVTKLTARASEALDSNIALLPQIENELKKQAVQIDITKPLGQLSQLELCILRKRQYTEGIYSRPDLYQRINGLDENTKEYKDIQSKLNAIEKLPKDYPLIRFLSGSTDSTKVTGEIEKAVKTVSDAQNKIKQLIEEGKFPVWELEELVEAEKATYTDPKEIAEIDAWLKKQKTNKKIKDILMTLVPIGLSLIVFFIPGGASLLLLGIKAGAQILNAGLGAVSAYQDFKDAKTELLRANADVILSDAQIDLLQSQGKNAAVLQFFLFIISTLGAAADIADSAKMLKLYNKADSIGPAARARLRQCPKLGANQLQECSESGLRFIGKIKNEENAVYILNMGNNVVDAIGKSRNEIVLADNLSKLSVAQLPKAFNFFPDKLNANIIWLGTEGVDANKVLTCGKDVADRYNKIVQKLNENLDLIVDFSKPAEKIECEINSIVQNLVRNKTMNFEDEAEHIALLRESLSPGALEKSRIYMRVQGKNEWKTLASDKKEFAWMTDPLMINFKEGIPAELMDAVGFTKDYAKTEGKLEKVFADFVIFKDAKTAEKYIGSNDIIGWDKILDDFYSAMDKEISEVFEKADTKEVINLDAIKNKKKLKDDLGDLITDNGKFNKKLFNEKYYNYFVNEHVPGTPYPEDIKGIIGAKIEEKTGASYLFEGGGITVEEKGGLKSIERPLHRINDGIDSKFDIDTLSETNDIRVFRFEVTSDTDAPISIVEIGADAKK